MVLFCLRLSGVVQRGVLCGPADREICQPRISQRPPLPHLRLWRGAGDFPSGSGAGALSAALPLLGGAVQRAGVGDRLCAGKALPSEVVGLLRPALQPQRLYLPPLLPAVGLCLPDHHGYDPSGGDRDGAAHPPPSGAGAAGDRLSPLEGGAGDDRRPGGPLRSDRGGAQETAGDHAG